MDEQKLDHDKYMRMAITEARKCKPIDPKIHPKVGAVIVTRGGDVYTGYRGEYESGEHAEFTALEKKGFDEVFVGATVYTTLEPCNQRNRPKVACANRLVERRVSKVFIGMLDPNPAVYSKGLEILDDNRVDYQFFHKPLREEIEELNRDFIRHHKGNIIDDVVSPEVIRAGRERSLDEWYREFNHIYWNKNFTKEPSDLLAHLMEVIGAISLLASNKEKKGVNPHEYVSKSIAWWMALCGRVGVKSVEDMLWDKFPRACPYCQQLPHNSSICREQKEANKGVQWTALTHLQEKNEKPRRLGDWQRMFNDIYPASETETYASIFGRLTEELGELAEALRVFRVKPGYFLSEASDVFAWLMHLQNYMEVVRRIPSNERGDELETQISKAYPNGCLDCKKTQCVCPPILPSTIGRIADEVPTGRGGFDTKGRFMTPDKASKYFLDRA